MHDGVWGQTVPSAGKSDVQPRLVGIRVGMVVKPHLPKVLGSHKFVVEFAELVVDSALDSTCRRRPSSRRQ